jgi:hypothetical protein
VHDGYHQEGHDLLISLITDLYIQVRRVNPLPAETLASVIPNLANPATLAEFEQRLSSEAQPAQQRKIVKEALRGILGLKPGQWFRNAASGEDGLGKNMKRMAERFTVKKRSVVGEQGWHDAVDSGAPIDLGLLDLFRP